MNKKCLWGLALSLAVSGLMAAHLSAEEGASHMFEHHIETRIDIQASANQVWDALLTFDAYPAWNPFILQISGGPEVGRALHVTVKPAGGSVMSFSPSVLQAESGQALRWKGKFLMPGLFDGEHYFLIQPQSSGGVTLVHGEMFSGVLVPFFKGQLDKGTKAGFEAMNQALRERVMSIK